MGRGKAASKQTTIIRRGGDRVVGVFVHGPSLDRATKRLGKRVDFEALGRGVSSGTKPLVARYYTLLPNEDDSRHRSFLEAVSKAGFEVVVKRMPPKGVDRPAQVEIQMAADICAFSKGALQLEVSTDYSPLSSFKPQGPEVPKDAPADARLSAVIVCPTPDLSYPIKLAGNLGAQTTTADFGNFSGPDVLKSSSRWIDLSTSESIWQKTQE